MGPMGARPLGVSTSGITNVASHTPDGRAITHSGPPCAHCGTDTDVHPTAPHYIRWLLTATRHRTRGDGDRQGAARAQQHVPPGPLCVLHLLPALSGRQVRRARGTSNVLLLRPRQHVAPGLIQCVRDVQGKPYCEEHYWEVYAPRCHACQQPIREGVIKYVSAVQYHICIYVFLHLFLLLTTWTCVRVGV